MIIIAASALAALSCKKEEEEAEVLPSLEGNLSFHAPQFIEPGQTLTMTPKGLVHPEDKGIGFYWKVTPAMTSSDTTRLENGLSPEGEESDGSFTYTSRTLLRSIRWLAMPLQRTTQEHHQAGM